MLDSARTVQRIASRISREQLLQDRDQQLLLERAIEIIGEAAARVSQRFRARHSEIPWTQIIGLRNVIVHQYGDVDYEIIWQVAKHDVPDLRAQIERIIPPVEGD